MASGTGDGPGARLGDETVSVLNATIRDRVVAHVSVQVSEPRHTGISRKANRVISQRHVAVLVQQQPAPAQWPLTSTACSSSPLPTLAGHHRTTAHSPSERFHGACNRRRHRRRPVSRRTSGVQAAPCWASSPARCSQPRPQPSCSPGAGVRYGRQPRAAASRRPARSCCPAPGYSLTENCSRLICPPEPEI